MTNDNPAHVVCPQCNEPFYFGDGVKTIKNTDKGTIELHFCTERCANEWYLNMLYRNEGVYFQGEDT